MNIHFNSLSNYTTSFFKESLLPTLTNQQKKILIIASVAFGFLAACYAMYHYAKRQKEPSDSNELKNDNTDDQHKNTLTEIYDSKSGKYYVGHFDDKFTGTGKVTETGSYPGSEEGKFLFGKLNGQGTRTSWGGKVEQGIFKDGDLMSGTITEPGNASNLKRVLEGTFTYDVFKGKITHSNGTIEDGSFNIRSDCLYKEYRLDGKGKITYANGLSEKGYFSLGRLSAGKINQDGIIKEGLFDYHRNLNGAGKITYPDGKVEKGTFKDGKLIQAD